MELNGVSVILEPSLGKFIQVKFPRSKKKRIRRKWTKNSKYYAWVDDNQVYQMDGVLYMHPNTWERIQKTLDNDK